MLETAEGTGGITAEMQAIDRALATIVFGLDGTIRRANSNFLQLFGYSEPEVIGRNHKMFVARDEAAGEAYAAFWDGLRRGESRSADFSRLRKGGSRLWIEATYMPVVDAHGQVFEIVKFATDVTARKLKAAEDGGQIIAINTSQAVIHFGIDGTILSANDLFLEAMGYKLEEVVGRHHRMFVDPAEAASPSYAAFWNSLSAGHHEAAEYKRFGRDGREVWLQATYSPILDMNGAPVKIVKYATDVSREKLRQADYEGQIAAIHKSQAVITFDMDGTVIDANDHFLDAMGYRLDEIEGRHHRMFVDPSYAHGPEYAAFWSDLSQGRPQAAEYRRLGKDGREVWLQATYNPVRDLNGQPFKVVKYATVVTREKLRQADHQGQIASIHKAQCVISFDLDGIILDANDNFLEATGYRLAAVRGKHHRMFVDPIDADGADYASFWADLARGRHRSGEYKRLCKDGREIWLQATYNPIFDMNGRPFKVVKYATDITQERLRQADYEGQIAAIRKSQCVIAFDMDGAILDANQNFLDAMGYRQDEIEGRHHRMFVEQGVAESPDYKAFWETLRSGTFLSAKFKRVGKGGSEVWIQASYNPIFDLNGRPFKVIKIATDVTAEVALAVNFHDARQQALHDVATSLPNRAGLSNFMSSALGEPDRRLAILYLDLDHFKPINDTFGHHVGDHVLRQTADRLRRALAPNQIVARIGGDEFVVAAPNLSDEAIDSLCHRLIEVVKAPIRHDKGTLAVGLSIGVAVSPGDASTSDDLLRCADVALYRSKGNGRGSYSFYADDMNERIVANRHLADEMRHGIKAGQFYLEFQPRFNVDTRKVQSVEALVRWMHPERGRIEPADFIGLAEKSGLIVPLGEWVMRAACHAAIGWPGVGVSVNISPVQFRSSDLVAVVDAVLSETGLDAGRLELEIAESVLLEDVARAHAEIDALRERGVRLAMADVGSGSSSLNNLRDFRVDCVKIDRSLIADIEGQQGGREIVQGILGLGRALGMSVTAEGVETAGQLLLLGLDDCSEVQGFLLAQPMAVEDIGVLLLGEHASAGKASYQPRHKADMLLEHIMSKSAVPTQRPRGRGRKDGGATASA